MAEAPAEDFSTQLASVDPTPTCQPRSYEAVAASNITTSKQLQEAHYVYLREERWHYSTTGSSLLRSLPRAARRPQGVHLGGRSHAQVCFSGPAQATQRSAAGHPSTASQERSP